MELDDAITFLNSVISQRIGRSLSEVEIALIKGAWNNEPYDQIAQRSGYSSNYLQRDIGPKFWKLLSTTLNRQLNKTNLRGVLVQLSPGENRQPAISTQQTDWGEANDVSIFYGRSEELQTLKTWIQTDRCRLITVLGMGGIGKSALATKSAQCLQAEFDSVIWRSLRNAPPFEQFLQEILAFVSRQQATSTSLPQLLQYFRSARCLLILDNMETILEQTQVGQFRSGYQQYGELLHVVGESSHQSCVLVTSREKPADVASLEGEDFQVRSMRLTGSPEAAMALLRLKGLIGTPEQQQQLCDHYGNSPLALKIVATSIREIFNGAIAPFLTQDTIVFNGIRRLLDQQFQRLSTAEQALMYWLAINREPTTVTELREDIRTLPSTQVLLDALESLSRRSLIEQTVISASMTGFTQQSVVMEYVTEHLIQLLSQEILDSNIKKLNQYLLTKAQAKDYIRAAQTRLILMPVLEALQQGLMNVQAIVTQLSKIIAQSQQSAPREPGYLASNLISLFSALEIDLRHYDFSNLAISQAYLAKSNLQYANFAHCDFSKTVFAQAFGSVLSVAFSTNGDQFATVDDHGEIQIWRTQDSQFLINLTGHENWVWTIAFSPTQPILASGSHDQTIRLWNLDDRQCTHILRGHTNWVWSVVFSPDGRTLASGSWDQTIRIWDVQTGECLRVLQQHTGWVRSVAFSPDGKYLISGSQDAKILLWDWQTGDCLTQFIGHESQVWSVAFSPDGRYLVSGSDDCTVRIWQVSSGQCLSILKGHSKTVRSVVFHPSGNLVASGSEDQTIRLWSLTSADMTTGDMTGELITGELITGQHHRTLMGHTSQVWTLVFHPIEGVIASGSGDQTVRFWDIQNGQCLKVIQGHASHIWSVAFQPADGQFLEKPLLASGHGDHTLRLWTLPRGECVKILRGHTNWVWSVAFSPDGQLLASSSGDQTIRLWNPQSGQCVRILRGHGGWIWSVSFSPNGAMLGSGCADLTVRLWETKTGVCLRVLQGHTSQVRSVSFSPDGQLIASSGGDKTIRVWDTSSGDCCYVLTEHTDWVWSVCFSPDGQWLASGSGDRTIRLWNQTGDCVAQLHGHLGAVRSVRFSQDSQTLISSSEDQTVRLWDLKTGKCFQILTGHTSWVWSVVSQDGWIASSSADETIKIWDGQTGNCLGTLRAERPYEGMNIANVTGISEAQKATLKALGAVDTAVSQS